MENKNLPNPHYVSAPFSIAMCGYKDFFDKMVREYSNRFSGNIKVAHRVDKNGFYWFSITETNSPPNEKQIGHWVFEP